MADILEEGSVYNFSTRAPGILGSRFTHAKLEATTTYVLARKFENIDLKYRQIFPLLPAGTPDSLKSSVFYIFTLPTGATAVLADQWIDMTSVERVDAIEFTVTFRNSSISKANRVRDILNAMGEKFVIEVKS